MMQNRLKHEGPRERLLRAGSRSLSDSELLAVLLRTGRPGRPATALAADILHRHDGLAALLQRCPQALLEEPGVGPATLSLLLAGLELARRCAEEAIAGRDLMSCPEQTRRFLQHHLAAQRREVFCCLYLDAQHRLLSVCDLFSGSIDGAAVYPREVVEAALLRGATAVILAHNHPSGVASPSTADRRITERLQQALALIDVRVLDHVIVARGAHFSFAEAGLI